MTQHSGTHVKKIDNLHLPWLRCWLLQMHAITDPQHRIAYPPLRNGALLDAMRRCLDRNPRTRISMQARAPASEPRRAIAAVGQTILRHWLPAPECKLQHVCCSTCAGVTLDKQLTGQCGSQCSCGTSLAGRLVPRSLTAGSAYAGAVAAPLPEAYRVHGRSTSRPGRTCRPGQPQQRTAEKPAASGESQLASV